MPLRPKPFVFSCLAHCAMGVIVVLAAGISLFRKNRIPGSALILPPDPPGGMGDDKMMTVTLEQLKKHNVSTRTVLYYRDSDEWHLLDPELHSAPLPAFSIRRIIKHWKGNMQCLEALRTSEQLFCIGADIIDGSYNELHGLQRVLFLFFCARLGLRVTVLGFSYSTRAAPSVSGVIRRFPYNARLCVRDPRSYERVRSIRPRNTQLVADIAFLLKANQTNNALQPLLDWIAEQKRQQFVVIGLNASHYSFQAIPGCHTDDIAGLFARSIQELLTQESSCRFVLLPHDLRSTQSDVVIADAILSLLPSSVKLHCKKLVLPCRGTDLRFLCRQLDFAVSGRMHLAIDCLGEKVPVACLPYQDKFEGLFQDHFPLGELLLNTSSLYKKGSLVSGLLPLLKRRDQIRTVIADRLPHIQKLASLNFLPPAP